jgi:hypothetical protein
MLKGGQRKEHISMVDLMSSHGGRSGGSIMMEEDLFSNGQTSGLRQSWGPNGETSGKRNFSVGLVHVRGRHGMYHLTATVGQERGERNTLETERFTSTERVPQEKAGT